LVLAGVLPAMQGCDDYLDINDDPNNPTTAPMSGLLARTSFETGDNIQNAGNITSYFVQYLASPNAAGATDTHEPVPHDQTWFELYDVMTDLSDLELQAADLGDQNYLGIAKILKAINLGLTIDMWGYIPYSESFFAETLNPSYDTDQALYDEIMQLLNDGISALEDGSGTFVIGSDDFIYGGNLDLWIKTAHALKARYLLHLSETADYDPQMVLAEAGMAYDGNGEDATVVYYEQERNPWASVAIANDGLILGGWISEQIIDMMDGSLYNVVDPRMPFMFGTTDEGEFVGTENGAGRGDAAADGERSTLETGTYYASVLSPIEIITYAELKFIEAEAALSTDKPRAYNAYIAGIAAHHDKLGVADSEAQAYITHPAVAVGSANLTIDHIMKEKYIALFLHPETWVDARRYDFQYAGMTLPANLNPELGGKFSLRLIYPESETQRNGANVPDVDLLTPMWWDK
jgi:hypothetical protein